MIPSPRDVLDEAMSAILFYLGIVIVVLIALALVSLLAGCATPATSATVTPDATVAPEVHAGDNAEILTAIRQVQTTLSTVTTNYALDAERAKLERARERDARNAQAGTSVVLIGLGLLFLVLPAPALGAWRGTVIVVAICMVAGGALVPVLWPF